MRSQEAPLVLSFWQYAPVEDLHHHSLIWLNNLAFWRDELDFLGNLVEEHFAHFLDVERFRRVRPLSNEIRLTLMQTLSDLEGQVEAHEKKLSTILLQRIQDEKALKGYRADHGNLEDRINDFERRFRKVKNELFLLAKEVLKTEKMLKFINLSA